MKVPFWHRVRWKFILTRSRIHIRAGLILFEVCIKDIQPRINNVCVDELVSGAWIIWLPLGLHPGQSMPIHGWQRKIELPEEEWV